MLKEFIHNFNNSLFSKIAINTIIIAVLFVPFMLSAAGPTSPAAGVLKNPLKVKTVSELIGKLLDIIIEFGAPLAALVLVYTGYTFVTSMGNDKKLEQAKNMFWWTVIGTALIVGAKAIQSLVDATIKSVVT